MPRSPKPDPMERRRLSTLAQLGERLLRALEESPEATDAYRALWGPERDEHEVIQAAVTQARVAHGEDPP